MVNKSLTYLRSLVRELASLPDEIERVEFKCNNEDPERIAKYISGLSNAAALEENPYGYLVWCRFVNDALQSWEKKKAPAWEIAN